MVQYGVIMKYDFKNVKTGNYVIVDIDGTIANCDHRMHFIKNKYKSDKNWRDFFLAAKDDTPIQRNIDFIKSFLGPSTTVVFSTGRSDIIRAETIDWIRKYWSIDKKYFYLSMRRENDHRPDFLVKMEHVIRWVKIPDENGEYSKPYMIFDDRDSVIEYYRKANLPVFDMKELK